MKEEGNKKREKEWKKWKVLKRIAKEEKKEKELKKNGIPRIKNNYRNSRAEQGFNLSFQQRFPDFFITKKGFADFMIMDKDKNCIGFIEVKKHKGQELKLEQEIFKKFCEKYNIPYMIWYLNLSKSKKRKQIEQLNILFNISKN